MKCVGVARKEIPLDEKSQEDAPERFVFDEHAEEKNDECGENYETDESEFKKGFGVLILGDFGVAHLVGEILMEDKPGTADTSAEDDVGGGF